MLTAATTRIMSALLMAVWTVAVCCCPSVRAAQPAVEQPATEQHDDHSCCASEGSADVPSDHSAPDPTSHQHQHDACGCEHTGKLANQHRDVAPSLEPVVPVAVLDLSPALFINLNDFDPGAIEAPVEESPPLPGAWSLYALHCLLTI